MSKQRDAAIAFGYDLLIQGLPETFFIGPRRRGLISPLRGLVLEIGAGTGLSLRYYSPLAHVVATDIDLASLRRLRHKAEHARAVAWAATASATNLPFAGGTFDGLVCNLALCTIPRPDEALAEARRVLKPGAPACFLEHVRASRAGHARIQEMLALAWAKIAGGCRLAQDTESIIRRSGLAVSRVEQRNGLLLPMKMIWARNPE